MINFVRPQLYLEVIYLGLVPDPKRKLFPFVTTFNPNLPDVGRIIRKHRVILESNPKLKELFPPNSTIASFRRSKNLKELLAHLVMTLTPNAKSLLRLGVVLNVNEQDAISVATSWLNQIPFCVFKQARVTRYDPNFLVILRTLFIWLRVRGVACNTLVLH